MNSHLKLREQQPVFQCEARNGTNTIFNVIVGFCKNYPSFIAPEGGSLIQYRQTINAKDAQQFYTLLSLDNSGEVSPLQVAAQIPAALLQLSEQRSGKIQGISRGIAIEFFMKPQLGEYRTEIRLVSTKGSREKGFIYGVEGICYQKDHPVVSGSMTILHPCDLRN